MIWRSSKALKQKIKGLQVDLKRAIEAVEEFGHEHRLEVKSRQKLGEVYDQLRREYATQTGKVEEQKAINDVLVKKIVDLNVENAVQTGLLDALRRPIFATKFG